jgi:hypothetical protein
MAAVYMAMRRRLKCQMEADLDVKELGEEKGRSVRCDLGLMTSYSTKNNLTFLFKIPKKFWNMTKGRERLLWDYMGKGPFYQGVPIEDLLPYLDYCTILVIHMSDVVSVELQLSSLLEKLNLVSERLPIKSAPEEVLVIIGSLKKWEEVSESTRQIIKQKLIHDQ